MTDPDTLDEIETLDKVGRYWREQCLAARAESAVLATARELAAAAFQQGSETELWNQKQYDDNVVALLTLLLSRGDL